MSNKNDKLSVFISLILRHKPEVIGIHLDEYGYANVCELINGINNNGRCLDLKILKEIVNTDKKGRYSFNEDFTKIKANQGHSINVNLELKECVPPEILYHGTHEGVLVDILNNGIKKMDRHHVHLSEDINTAKQVGSRRGKSEILEVHAKRMFKDGYKFYLSENEIWLTDYVPNFYITVKM